MLFPTVNYASAHNNLNSDDQTIGNYEVQVATDPEIPEANHPFKLSFRVLNHQSASNILNSLNTQISEVSQFRVGVRIYYNDQLVEPYLCRALARESGQQSIHFMKQEIT